MSYTNSYINNVYANHIDLGNLYNKSSTYNDLTLKTIETAGKYVIVATGNLALTLSLSIIPITVALDIIDTLGILFRKLANGQVSKEDFFNIIVAPFSMSAVLYYLYTYEFFRNTSNLNINDPRIAALVNRQRSFTIAFSAFSAGLGISGILVLTESDFFNKSFENAWKISKIVTSALCPPLAYNP